MDESTITFLVHRDMCVRYTLAIMPGKMVRFVLFVIFCLFSRVSFRNSGFCLLIVFLRNVFNSSVDFGFTWQKAANLNAFINE